MAILTYHHIGAVPAGQEAHKGLFVPPQLFGKQLAWLIENGYTSVSLETLVQSLAGQATLPRKWVCITFDDGFRDNCTAGFPLLQQYGFSATIFLVTDKVARLAPTGNWDDYLTADDIGQMRDAGIDFGSHTHSHPRLTKLTDDQAQAELITSRDRLTNEFGLTTDWFCYPYGNFSPRIAGLVRQAGYRCALSTIRDNRVHPDQLYWMPRVMVMNDTQPDRLKYMMSAWYHYVHAWKNRKRWKSLR